MHVGLILEHSDPSKGGAEAYASALVRRLRAEGHQVSVASRTGPASRPLPACPASLRPWQYARKLLPALRREGAEVVLSFPPVPGSDFYQPHAGILRRAIRARLEP
ncbi:MAG: glycosyltransferase, partial [Planctomycetota bacterium]